MEDVGKSTTDDICDKRSKSKRKRTVEKKIGLSILQRYFIGSLKYAVKSIGSMQAMVFDQ